MGTFCGVNFPAQFETRTSEVLQLVLEQSQDAIQFVDRAGLLEYVNPYGMAAMELSGWDRADWPTWVDLWSDDTRERAHGALKEASTGHPSQVEVERLSSSGTARPWSVTVSPILDESGAIAHFLIIAREPVVSGGQQRAGDTARRNAERNASHSEAIAKEMRHRFKNQLAVVGAVLKLQARHSETPAEVAAKFERKLAALARAQDLLAESHLEPLTAQTALAEVI